MTRLGTVELDGAYVIDAGACHGRRLHYGHGRRQRIRDHRAMRPQAGPLTAAAIAFCPARLSRLAGMVKPGPFGTKFYFRTDLVTASPIASSTPDAGHHAHRARVADYQDTINYRSRLSTLADARRCAANIAWMSQRQRPQGKEMTTTNEVPAEREGSRPASAPAYYLGRPARLWITASGPRHRRTRTRASRSTWARS